MKHGFANKRFVLFAGPVITLGLCGCGVFQRHPESGYSSRSGYLTNRSQFYSGGSEVKHIETKTRLKQLENGIQTKKEMEQYSMALPYLRNEDERIMFLSLADYEARQKWLKENGLNSRTLDAADSYHDLVEAQDIGVGMTQKLVRRSWGEPENVEVSGNPQFRNEKWRYNRYVSTQDGYKMEKKIVYFEAGRVVGWEVE